jgi:hypothetical protein
MINRVKRRLIPLLIVSAAATALASDATGRYDVGCSGATFHLTKVPDHHSSREFTLYLNISIGLFPNLAGPDWWDVNGERCSGGNACDNATSAKLQFQKIEKRHVVGHYQIDSGGQHFEGTFRVKYRHQGERVICE